MNGSTSKRRSVAASNPAISADCAEITRMTLRAAYRNRVTGSRCRADCSNGGPAQCDDRTDRAVRRGGNGIEGRRRWTRWTRGPAGVP